MFYQKLLTGIWKIIFFPNFNGLQRINQNFTQKRSFYKKDSLAHYPPCCTCFGSREIPVSVQGNFEGFSAEDEETGSNWFLLSQTFNQKRKYCYGFQVCWI